jgi:hypothetical protein
MVAGLLARRQVERVAGDGDVCAARRVCSDAAQMLFSHRGQGRRSFTDEIVSMPPQFVQ